MVKIWSGLFQRLSSNILILVTLEGLVIFSVDRVLAQNSNPTIPLFLTNRVEANFKA